MRLLIAAASPILLVSAEMTSSWASWSKPFFESATALIKTVCEPGLVNPLNAVENFINHSLWPFSAKAID